MQYEKGIFSTFNPNPNTKTAKTMKQNVIW